MLSFSPLQIVLGFAAAALALTGCTSDESSGTDSPVFPTGSYNVLATPTQVITFSEDGTYAVSYPDRVISEGTYTIEGDTYTSVTDTHCASEGVSAPGVYTWSWDGQTLTMTPQGEDECGARAEGQAGGMVPVSTTPEAS